LEDIGIDGESLIGQKPFSAVLERPLGRIGDGHAEMLIPTRSLWHLGRGVIGFGIRRRVIHPEFSMVLNDSRSPVLDRLAAGVRNERPAEAFPVRKILGSQDHEFPPLEVRVFDARHILLRLHVGAINEPAIADFDGIRIRAVAGPNGLADFTVSVCAPASVAKRSRITAANCMALD
jgi:hypothetical protein